MGESRSGAAETDRAAEAARQVAYHNELFAALYDWNSLWQLASDVCGSNELATRLALDQLGHFGPLGVELVARRLIEAADAPPRRVVELGSGFGGALRHLGRLLRAHGWRPCLVGIEIAAEHTRLTAVIDRATGGHEGFTVQGDARALPLRPASIDAVVATGSASHFAGPEHVVRECARTLRPGGLLVMTDEIGLRTGGTTTVTERFLAHHPPDVFHASDRRTRRADLEQAGFAIEAFDSLANWALPLVRQRVKALKLLGACAHRMFGASAYERLMGTLTSAADEYERGSVEPAIIVARRAA